MAGSMGWPVPVSVEKQDFDAAGFCVVAGASGLLGFAENDALRQDALGDECIAYAKGATLGQFRGGVSEILCAGPERLPHHGGVAGD